MTTETLFRGTGLLAAVIAGVQGLVGYYLAGPQCAILLPGSAQVWSAYTGAALGDLVVYGTAGIMVFAAAFWETTRPSPRHSALGVVLLLAVQILIGLAIEPHMLIMVAAEFPFIVSRRASLLCLLGLAVLLGAIGGYFLYHATPLARLPIAVNFASIVAWQIFAFVVGYIATFERRNRRKLAADHAQLMATQQLLAESSRTAERLHIARELHDALGHHLAALSLHLDLAARQAVDAGCGSMRTAREIARSLLADVRAAVSAARNERPIDLRQALGTLCAGIPAPRVDLSMDECVRVGDAALAHVVFRSVQEALSNAIRHSDGNTVNVALSCENDGIRVVIRDDGRGIDVIAPGSGLRGMRERVEEQGGTLETESRAGAGFYVRIWLPQRGRRP